MNRILPGDPRNAEPIDQNFQELLAIINALTDANFAQNAGLVGSKLAVNSLPADRIVSSSITQMQMGNQSVGTAQLRDGETTRTKLSTTVGSRITAAQTEKARQSVAFNIGAVAGSTYIGGTLLIVQSGGNYSAQLCWQLRNETTKAVTIGFQPITPSPVLPIASTFLDAVYLESTAGLGSLSAAWQGNVYFVSIVAS